ncbi:hypothetical protein GGX14DRAFT_384024 [Mycena pura]|uniref:Uncharacterized protein n=1 Tax=Mycena pura TaxID=153505 RepID=A0AAD6YUF7_9AGAR|nr:hypothetical protein GGX14DRAFT_384024 [Mycena pura]
MHQTLRGIMPVSVYTANGNAAGRQLEPAIWPDPWNSRISAAYQPVPIHEVENVKVSTMRRRAGRNGQCGSANGGAQKEEGGIHHGRLDMKKARTKAECFDLAKVLQALEGADRMTRQGKLEKGQDSKAQGTGRDLGRRRARSRTTNNQPPESQVRTAGAKIWLTSGYPLVTSWHVQLNDPAGGRVQHSPTPGGAFGGYRLATRLESTPRPVDGVEQDKHKSAMEVEHLTNKRDLNITELFDMNIFTVFSKGPPGDGALCLARLIKAHDVMRRLQVRTLRWS